MSREKASVNFSERLVSSTRHGNDNFVRAAKAISAISKWQDTDHLWQKAFARTDFWKPHGISLLRNPRNNISNIKKKITLTHTHTPLSLCAAKQNDPSSCLLYVLLIEITFGGTQHKRCSHKDRASNMTFLRTFRTETDLNWPGCRACIAVALMNLPGIPHLSFRATLENWNLWKHRAEGQEKWGQGWKCYLVVSEVT